MMVRYYGHHGLKQFIRGKPIRFRYKIWSLIGGSGYCFNFLLYCGKEKKHLQEPLETRVANKMLDILTIQAIIKFISIIFFSSSNLFTLLKQKDFRATGTVRDNRTLKFPLKPLNTIQICPRGTYSFQFGNSDKILIVKWNINRAATMGTIFDKIEPLSSVSQWSQEKKERVQIPQHSVIANYNKYIGGFDHHYWLLDRHAITARGKKWCLFTRILNMCIVNRYFDYVKIHLDEKISIKDFRRNIAQLYLTLGHGKRILEGRPMSLPSTFFVLLFIFNYAVESYNL
ncbi:piggyBac transposable element-derived protein 3-like [Hydra vulgaris]|uniref:PiggyBac transposable element-derived protein 3-like n=1 Tax=Hydra vulgaris TaxID=6087 RepID=A0ABM4CSH8_HYDVU